ncbi:MAG: type II and III secretion system protein family protein [Enhydrobacter sp.]|nr:MAG: type II and III secretion system protein family protein [Enhydrobacter sp.]
MIAVPSLRPIWPLGRLIGRGLALAAAMSFALHPAISVAQSVATETGTSVDVKSKPSGQSKRSARKVSKRTPSDTVAEELNRREAERAARLVQSMSSTTAPSTAAVVAPAAAIAKEEAKDTTPLEPPTVAAIPPRAAIVSASLTTASGSGATGPITKIDTIPENRPPRHLAQTQPPAPVPIPPPATVTAPQSAAPQVTGAQGRSFGQNQIVPPQQPTLSLEVNKGTALKLPGPAATVFVAAPDIADVQVRSPGMIYVFAKKPGDTVLYAVDDQDRVLLNTIVSVTSPVSRMKATLDRLHPGNGVVIENQGESIVLSGVVRSGVVAEDARRLALQHVNGQANKVIGNIRVDAPTQVQLRVKIAEVNRSALKRVGINWQNINSIALFGLGPVQAGFATQTIQVVGGAASGAISIQSNDGSLTSFIDLLATQGEATILAEPNLIALSGETASFLAGGEIPVVSPQSGSITTTFTVMYKQVGVSLGFTPTIVGDRINLKVAPEVSQVTSTGEVSIPVGSGNLIIPAVQTRRASTTVELGSGQSFAIAGLLQNSTVQTISKLPALGDIPILGTLFKSDAYQRNETELVILVTPYFVEPVNTRLQTPLTGRVPPTDADRLFYQRVNHPTPPRRIGVGPARQAGPSAGFTLD